MSKKFDKGHLPVDYYSQKKAWMDGEIMELVLAKLNRRLSHTGRFILLLMNNAGIILGIYKEYSAKTKCVFFLPIQH